MPLHLLGKKSWNVYNPENIERVRRDEAIAKAENERVERDKQSNAAASRLQALRGEDVSDSLSVDQSRQPDLSPEVHRQSASRKRRKLAGENDTDRDIRLARSDAEIKRLEDGEDAVFDSKGHVNLVSKPVSSQRSQQDQEQEVAQTGMRFKDAAGFKSDGVPWYTNKSAGHTSELSIGKDVWGNEDPRRKDREQQRMVTNDPLLAMRKGVKKLRENEQQRKEWIKQRERDLYEVEALAREKERRQRGSDDDSLEDFSLDRQPEDSNPGRSDTDNHKRRHHHHRRHRHRHRSRSPERDSRHHRHRSRSKRDSVADQP